MHRHSCIKFGSPYIDSSINRCWRPLPAGQPWPSSHRGRGQRAREREIAKFGKPAGEPGGIAVIEIGHATDIVSRAERAELDLNELGERQLILLFGFGRGVVAVVFAKLPMLSMVNSFSPSMPMPQPVLKPKPRVRNNILRQELAS